MLERRELDLFATNKPTLFQMSDQMPGARVLDGRWGVEHIAIAIPRGRKAALERASFAASSKRCKPAACSQPPLNARDSEAL